MPAVPGGLHFKEISRHWHALAVRRVAYYEELYRSGRWRHYYPTSEHFAARMLDVIRAARVWAELAERRVAEKPVPAAGTARNLRPAA